MVCIGSRYLDLFVYPIGVLFCVYKLLFSLISFKVVCVHFEGWSSWIPLSCHGVRLFFIEIPIDFVRLLIGNGSRIPRLESCVLSKLYFFWIFISFYTLFWCKCSRRLFFQLQLGVDSVSFLMALGNPFLVSIRNICLVDGSHIFTHLLFSSFLAYLIR